MPYDFIFCSDDLRLCLAARSLTCPGFNFVFTSLLRQNFAFDLSLTAFFPPRVTAFRSFSELSVSEAHKAVHDMPAWMIQSMQSCTQEIYHVKVPPEMSGSSFSHVCLCCMFMSSSLIFGVVTIHGTNQTFTPNPLGLLLSDDHILAIFSTDQNSANDLVAQISMTMTKLSEASSAEAALSYIQRSEGPDSILQTRSQENLSQLVIIFREMQLLMHSGRHGGRPSSPYANSDPPDRTSIDIKSLSLSNARESSPATSARPRSLIRSSTLTAAVSESFLPPSRRDSTSVPLHALTSHSPLLRSISTLSQSSSPLLKHAGASGKPADGLGQFSNLSPLRRLTRADSIGSRERRDSDSSAAASSVVHHASGAQVRTPAAAFHMVLNLTYGRSSFGLNSWRGLGC
jgi:hypothetical protein